MKYLTVNEYIWLNGYRHYVRGLYWLSSGYTMYALGSFIKAFIIFERELNYKAKFDISNKIVLNHINILSMKIANGIINGNNSNS